jgi:hypothetical protein
LKIVHSLYVQGDGCIGSGVDDMSYPETIWECPMSHEAWLHRIIIWSPQFTASNPLTTGQIVFLGSTGTIIAWSPLGVTSIAGDLVIPFQVSIEGAMSAPHLSPGEKFQVVGDQLPSGIQVHFYLQLNLVAGMSPDTPVPYVGTSFAPTNGD